MAKRVKKVAVVTTEPVAVAEAVALTTADIALVQVQQDGGVSEMAAVADGPAAGEVDGNMAEPQQEADDHHVVSSATMEYIIANASRGLKQVMGALRLLMTDKQLKRDLGPFGFELEDGKVPLETVKMVIAELEKRADMTFAPVLDKDAYGVYQSEELWREIGYDDLRRITGKDGGITVEELRKAAETKQAEHAEYQRKLDRRDDGPVVACYGDLRVGNEWKFQPASYFVVRNGERATYSDGTEIRDGHFYIRRDKATGELVVVADCPRCKKKYKQLEWENNKELPKEERVYRKYMPREDAEAKLEEIKAKIAAGKEHGVREDRKSQMDFADFEEERARRAKRSRGRDPWNGGGQRGGERSFSQRDQRRGRSADWAGRQQGRDQQDGKDDE